MVMKIGQSIAENLVRVIFGLACMLGGAVGVAFEAKQAHANNIILIACLVVFAFGLLLIPFVFTQFQTVVIFVAPGAENLPVVGPFFRRYDDKKPTVP